MKNYVRLQEYKGPKGHFQIKLPLNDIDGFTDEPGQCDIQDVENTFVDNFK